MTDTLSTIWGWAAPALLVFGSAAALAAAGIWALRRRRRSPRARAAAETERVSAGSALVELDDAVTELDLEVGLSGALYDGTAPGALRRARMTAQHVRDAAFEEFRAVTAEMHPDEIRRVSRAIRSRTDAALAAISRARAEHADWMRGNVTAAAQVDAARERCRALHAELGDPTALLAGLAERFDRSEWADAERAATAASTALIEADRLVDDAAARSVDPTRSALPVLADAERALRRAQAAARRLEERHRLIIDASTAVNDEIARARAALRHAMAVRTELDPDDADRLGAEARRVEESLSMIEQDAGRRPTAAVDAVARLRDRLDLALGDARSAQHRLRGARTALPGTLATARDAIARAEPKAAHAGADARVRLAAAQHELASARNADDPVAALDAARRAIRHAEDAVALADYDRMTRG